MENPEEVLQALDEFQKLRPADIPKELEEYLSWVAKTGDPVYQWPLIKALFREKLVRVMTDFYESCPTLELAPCPNVEQFNYDIMKSALLDRLESFASAPFTVQRICELLTAPRKEYNRVDKFMRAIEKNILVVSTREPGPSARRSENGDGMVNGSSEDNGSRSPYEMDLWTRACTLATTVTVQTVETHSAIVNVHNMPTNVIPATELTIVKNNTTSVEAFTPYGTDADICDTEMSSKSQDLPSTFTPSTSEIASIANLTSQIQPQDINSTSGIQNLSNMVTEPSSIVGDVPEAIMNEDTNSQPSLDLENNENDSLESTRKLQTTFQSSDFITHGIKSQKFYSEDNNKTIEKTVVEAESLRNDLVPLIEMEQKETENNPDTIKADPELKSSFETGEPATPATVIAADPIEMTENVDKITDAEPCTQNVAPIDDNHEIIDRNITSDDQTQVKESVIPDSGDTTLLINRTDSALLDITTEKDIVSCARVDTADKEHETTLASTVADSIISCTVETSVKITQSITITEETGVTQGSTELKISSEVTDSVAKEIRPVIESGKESGEINESKEGLEDGVKISDDRVQQPYTVIEELSVENDIKINKSIVPDPLPIIEEPKDDETRIDPEQKQMVVDVTDAEENKSSDPAFTSGDSKQEKVDTVETEEVAKLNKETTDSESNKSLSIEDEPTFVASSAPIEDIAPVESMEIGVSESSQIFQQDEPMEEEVSDLDKS